MNDKTTDKLFTEVKVRILEEYNLTSLKYWNCKPLAEKTGVKHDTLRRFLKRDSHKSMTKTLELLCELFEIEMKEKRKKCEPENSNMLMSALRSVWDGTSEHEAALAGLIKSAGAFKLSNSVG